MENANRVAKELPEVLAPLGLPGPLRPGEIFQPGAPLALIEQVRLAQRQACKEVTLWPLVFAGDVAAGGPDLWPLDEALEDGFVSVAAGARAGVVRIESRAPVAVWVPAGEPLGAVGRAAETKVLAPHGTALVCTAEAAPACSRCHEALVGSFRAVEGQVGFVVSVEDRAVGLELVLCADLLARRLRQRLESWASWLLTREAAFEESAQGLESPEALLAAVRRGGALCAGLRTEVAWATGSHSS